MKEVNDMAGQHELIAENLQDEVIREVTILVKDMKEDRKKVLVVLNKSLGFTIAYPFCNSALKAQFADLQNRKHGRIRTG